MIVWSGVFMARTYNNPPLIEAVCAFTFKNAQPWDLTIPGLVAYTVSPDSLKLDSEPETDIWVDMPPRSTRKVEMQAQYAGRGKPLPFDPLPED
jgi:hypothetical protein